MTEIDLTEAMGVWEAVWDASDGGFCGVEGCPDCLAAARVIHTALAERDARIRELEGERDEAVNWGHIVDLNGIDQFDDLAERWLSLEAIRRTHQAMASPFAPYASEDIMQRFLQMMRGQLQIAFVEGAIAGVKAEAARTILKGNSHDRD